MYGSARRWGTSLYKHVDAGDMTILQTERLDRFGNRAKILTPDDYVDIFRKTPRIWLSLFHVEIRGEAAHDAVFQASRRESLLDPVG
jgi:hypothetical protein